MNFNENDFFREATLKICGNLALEQALFDALLYIRDFLPVDVFFMEYFDPESSAARTIARADRKGGVPLDLLTPIPSKAHLGDDLKSPELIGKALVFNHPEEIPMAKTMLRSHHYDENKCSLLTMRLIAEGEFFGGLVALAEKRDAFTEDHAHLLALLAQPFTIALHNALQYRDALLTKDRLVDENEFFRNMTMRICGNLLLEEGLHACMEYLTRHIPGYVIYLQRYEHELGAMRLLVRADKERGERMDKLIPLPNSARNVMKMAKQGYLAGNLPPVFVINDSENEPFTSAMLNALGLPPSSAMSLPLIIGDQPAGSMALLAEGRDKFNEDHIRLYSTLKAPFFIAMTNDLRHTEVLKLKDALADDNRYLQCEMHRMTGDDIVGGDFGLKNVMEMVRQVAPMDSPVLLLGETGVGKDVIANAIHYSSMRRDNPFITVNSGAIPDSLIDSELFGHEKGAFTGALSQKRGRFERADRGTIFLDEIGELPPQAQVRLLRVLQNKEVERVGGSSSIPVDVRIIAATHRNLEDMIKSNQFREDLWFRINVFPIIIPPLRTRKEDIPALAHHFIERKAKQLKLPEVPTLAPGVIDRMIAYHWPGNVRELENIIERALILYKDGPLEVSMELGATATKNADMVRDKESITTPLESTTLEDVTKSHIHNMLGQTNGKVHGPGGAAELLGLNPSTLRNKMNKLGIRYGRSVKG